MSSSSSSRWSLACRLWRRSCHSTAAGSGVAESLRALFHRGCFQTVLPLKSEKYLHEYLDSAGPGSGRYFYCGFDPTADSLHLGNLLAVAGLLRLRALRQNVIFVVGGATGRIGDPSGREADRAGLADGELAANARSIGCQLSGIVANHQRHFCCSDGGGASSLLGEALVLNNQSWHEGLSAADLLSGHLSGMRLHDLLGKHTVQARLNSRHGMSVKEFLYPLFQAYDWLHLYNTYGCLVQIGGNDQIGNIDTGLICLRRSDAKALGFGLTVPLLTTSDGQKLGKSDQLADTVWLSAARTSPFTLYQRLRNTADADVGRMLRLFSFLPDAHIDELCRRHASAPEKYEAQVALADCVTLLLHGETGLSSARKWTSIVFAEDAAALASLTEADVAMTTGVDHQQQQVCVRRLAWRQGLSLRQLLLTLRDESPDTFGRLTRDQLERAIAAGRVSVNLRPVAADEADAPLTPDAACVLPGCGATLVKLGRRQFGLIKWTS